MSMNIEEMRQQNSNNEYFVLLDEFKEKLQNELGKNSTINCLKQLLIKD